MVLYHAIRPHCLALGVLISYDIQGGTFELLHKKLVPLFTAPFFLRGELGRSGHQVPSFRRFGGFGLDVVKFDQQGLE